MSGLHKKIKTFLLAVLMALPATVYAQIAEYSSRVIDAQTDEPLPMATVQGAAESTVTNIEGLFSVKADAGDVLKISYIGYKSVSIKASDIKANIKLKPADIQLKEVEVSPFTPTLEKIIKKSVKTLQKHHRKRANFLYRQTTEVDGTTSSMVEAFFNAYSTYNVYDMQLITGRYSENDKSPDKSFSHISNLYPLSQILLVSERSMPRFFGSRLMPIFKNYKKYFETDYDIIDDGERKVYSIRFVPHGNLPWAVFDGKVYVDAASLKLLRAEGRMRNVKIKTGYEIAENDTLPADLRFTVNFKEDSKAGEVESVSVVAEYENTEHKIAFSSILYNVGKRNVGKAIRADYKKDLRLQIDEIGYDRDFWRDNEIVKRTAVEEEIMRKKGLSEIESYLQIHPDEL